MRGGSFESKAMGLSPSSSSSWSWSSSWSSSCAILGIVRQDGRCPEGTEGGGLKLDHGPETGAGRCGGGRLRTRRTVRRSPLLLRGRLQLLLPLAVLMLLDEAVVERQALHLLRRNQTRVHQSELWVSIRRV